jgi:hypothetical protein
MIVFKHENLLRQNSGQCWMIVLMKLDINDLVVTLVISGDNG